MPIITDISEQVKSKGLYNIFVDGSFSFSLSETDIAKHDVKIGQEFSITQIEGLKEVSGSGKCYNFALRYLALRPRSEHEVREYLGSRKGFSSPQVDSAIERLLEAGYLNDKDFAQIWVRNRTLLKPRSSRMLQAELCKKGISADIIKPILNEYGAEEELDVLVGVINRKLSQSKYADQKKLMEYLSRQGYKYDLIKKAFKVIESYRR